MAYLSINYFLSTIRKILINEKKDDLKLISINEKTSSVIVIVTILLIPLQPDQLCNLEDRRRLCSQHMR